MSTETIRHIDDSLIEKLIIKACLESHEFLSTITVFQKEYFDNEYLSKSFEFLIDYLSKYNSIAPRTALINYVGNEEIFKEIDSIDFDVVKNYRYLFDETNNYLKDKAIKKGILDSVEIIDKGEEERNRIREIVEEALCKDLKVNLGLNYFGDLSERLRRILTTSDIRIPTYFPQLDEFISGGIPPYTLSVVVSRIHGFKCIGGDTVIKIKDKKNKILNTRIKDFFNRFDTKNSSKYYIEEENSMIGLEGMILKYGEKEGKRRYELWRSKVSEPGRGTLSYFVDRYGEKEGKDRYNQYIQKQKESHSEIGYIKKYGKIEGRKKWKERLDHLQDTTSLKGFILRYGDVEGKKKWRERQEKWQNTLKSKSAEEIKKINNKKAITLENLTKKYGEEEGKRRFDNWKIKISHSSSINGYIEKYGEEEGKKRFNSLREKKISNIRKIQQSSEMSNKFFIFIKENIGISFIREERIGHHIVDGLYKNLVVEFYGDYWHCNPRKYSPGYYNEKICMTSFEKWESDKIRKNDIESKGFRVVIVWENDYRLNKQKVLNNVLNNIKKV